MALEAKVNKLRIITGILLAVLAAGSAAQQSLVNVLFQTDLPDLEGREAVILEVEYPPEFEEMYFILSGHGVIQWKTASGEVREGSAFTSGERPRRRWSCGPTSS